ncbi:GNAT family N-acetyltransferase [Arthrobacter sp. UM1]|uniref:GNAT family N-acetyltransferase n=1 Tax=Arthrobacter sp. UM1 TaxID=2766776 RepID=UPI001CF713B4|nr:GNAT family N-acetyltransferase [Arthrobacter sp. UM1]MCB4208425.1 GNAT family N-acetyltransferase [Arthrobacter sp. UM1]
MTPAPHSANAHGLNAGFPDPGRPLEGDLVRLEPLDRSHLGGLQDAVEDGRIWDRWFTSVPPAEGMEAEIERRLALKEQGAMMPFTAVRQSDDEVLGMTSFYDIAPEVPRLEIGFTWNRASAHRTGTNTESKLLLLTYAFELWRAETVSFRTSWSNNQSRAAIARLGARQDGVLRGARRLRGGQLDDVVVFSLLKHEWPSVRTNLTWMLRER